MITPKEKALEMVENFRNVKHTKLSDYSVIYSPTAKVLAKLCVDEIINALKIADITSMDGSWYINEWEQVKQEIEKL